MADGSYANHADRKLDGRPETISLCGKIRVRYLAWDRAPRVGSVGLVKRRRALKAILSAEHVFIESPSLANWIVGCVINLLLVNESSKCKWRPFFPRVGKMIASRLRLTHKNTTFLLVANSFYIFSVSKKKLIRQNFATTSKYICLFVILKVFMHNDFVTINEYYYKVEIAYRRMCKVDKLFLMKNSLKFRPFLFKLQFNI